MKTDKGGLALFQIGAQKQAICLGISAPLNNNLHKRSAQEPHLQNKPSATPGFFQQSAVHGSSRDPMQNRGWAVSRRGHWQIQGF